MPVALHRLSSEGWERLGHGVTDADGRLRHFAEPNAEVELSAAVYRLDFETATYFAATGQTGFYPQVSVIFEITDPSAHYHVPLLLSPFAYSTYRGS